jgi:hypothetical protein
VKRAGQFQRLLAFAGGRECHPVTPSGEPHDDVLEMSCLTEVMDEKQEFHEAAVDCTGTRSRLPPDSEKRLQKCANLLTM